MKNLRANCLLAILCLVVSFSQVPELSAQDECEVSLTHEEGYTSTISSVLDNGDDTYTITIVVENDGCIGCKAINRYSIQATPGTYSDILVEGISGDFSFNFFDFGPNVRCFPFDGFGIVGVNGLGNGEAGSFSITYTLSGGLQDQVVQPRAPFSPMPLLFTADDFQSVLDCSVPSEPITPYYPPLEDGKSFDIIGSELTSLYNTFIATGNYISDDIFQIVGTNVIISIQTQAGQYLNALELLTSNEYGLSNSVGDASNNVISGIYPVANLLLLNDLPELLISASPIYAPLNNSGLITSQGDSAMRSFRARDVFRLDGSGSKIGVLSDSYNTILDDPAGDDVEKGDLPGTGNMAYPEPVDVLLDYPLGIRSDEGRAMLQIIHDVAPGASLAFRTGFLGPLDFANGILALDEADCDIIVDDITYINEPFFRDGLVAQAVDAVTANGKAYFSAAGNFGTKSWEGEFSATSAPGDLIGEAHNFAANEEGNDIYQSITVNSGDYTVVLQWDDGTPEFDDTASDFDIYLVNNNGDILFGFNRDNTGGSPFEVLPFTVQEDNTLANFLIVRASGSGPALLKYIVYRGDILINEFATENASTIVGQANAAGAITVGAVDYLNTPEYGGSPVIEFFSSWGGTSVNGIDRMKPDITGPNRVNTSVDLGGDLPQDDDIFFNFVGTSAAAPHAAALASLILEAQQTFYDDESSLLPGDIRNILQLSALDMGPEGYDRASGSGLILSDSALSQLANPVPFLTGLAYDTTLIPGIDSLELTIFGEYLKSGSVIYLDSVPIVTEISLNGSTELTATIPPTESPFPQVQVFNPSKEGTNGLDGGLSDPIFFTTKATILVSINNEEKPYGTGLPEFTASYSLIADSSVSPLESSDLTTEEIDRILSIELTTIANSLSNATLWGIEPSPTDPLNPESEVEATDALDISLLEQFDFVFSNGILTITPLDLIITPRDTTFTYNDSIVNLSFDYDFSTDPESEFVISEGDSLAITSALNSQHRNLIPKRAAAVRGTALVNDLGEPLLNAALLTNKGFFVTTQLRVARGTALVNGELIDPGIFAEAVSVTQGTETSARLARGTALVNTFKLVRGTALVNTVDSTGAVVNSTLLSDPSSLTNSTGFLNTTFVNEESNEETITIMGESDISILSGDSVGTVETIPTNLVTGLSVGTHFSLAGGFLTNNFNVKYGVGLVTILPDTLEISIEEASLTQTYDGSPKSIDITAIPDTIPFEITYNGESDLPVNAGTYEVNVNVLDTNFVGTVSTTTLIIEQVLATVSTGIFVIDEGDPLPAFSAEFDGFVNEENESVVTSLTFDVVDYFGFAGEFEIIPIAEAVNYSFESVSGTLFVNPTGPGTEAVNIKFICYELLEEPLEGGFNFIATFGYRNLNDSPLLIPAGENNQLLGENFDDSNLPQVFQPGTNFFTVPFEASVDANETPLTWALTSNRPEGVELRFASVSNIPCEDDAKANTTKGLTEKIKFGHSKVASLFPNPTAGKVMVSLDANSSEIESLEIYDNSGRKHSFEVTGSASHFRELNLTDFAEGIYIVRIGMKDGSFDSVNLMIKQQ